MFVSLNSCATKPSSSKTELCRGRTPAEGKKKIREEPWQIFVSDKSSEKILQITSLAVRLRNKRFHFFKGKSLSRVGLFATPWTVAHQAPPSMGFSRKKYWSRFPFPSPGNLLSFFLKPVTIHPGCNQLKCNQP